MGFPRIFMFTDRERVFDVVEAICGGRMHPSWYRIGGVAQDLPNGWDRMVRDFLDYMPARLDEYDKIALGNRILKARTRGVGSYSTDEAIEWGVTVLNLRACGFEWDFRKARPYSGYDQFEFDVPTGQHGDCYDRCAVRAEEIRQSLTQAAVNFIVFAQDPLGGGWRYDPQTPGDTSVVGWQLMALKSAQMAYLRVPPATMRKAGYFLDHVQSDCGAVYGYQRPESRRPATTAIGLLCRMYLGWKQDHEVLQRGVQMLGQLGPSTDKSKGMTNNMYYNYYATQVMHHIGGYPWQRWNSVMCDTDREPIHHGARSRQLVS